MADGLELPTSVGRSRDRYLDLLRALALVRIVTYHAFVWPWLTLAFPSLGVMFALAGSLMARSLEQRAASSVLKSRIRRVLVPFWAFGAIVVTAMIVHGWGPPSTADSRSWWATHLLPWLIPLVDPPFSAWAWQVNAPVWYIRAYLWFVLLSPLLLLTFRRRPWLSITALLVLVALLQSGVFITGSGLVRAILTDIAVYGPCWLLGFAHRDGLIDRQRPLRVLAVAATAMVIGVSYASTHPTTKTYNLGELPLAQALWSFGFVLILLRFQPRMMNWLARIPPLDSLVTIFNVRAVTIYLWHEVALIASVQGIDWMWSVPALADSLPLQTNWWKYLLTWPLLAVPVLLVGWIEDIAARRPPKLWPWRVTI